MKRRGKKSSPSSPTAQVPCCTVRGFHPPPPPSPDSPLAKQARCSVLPSVHCRTPNVTGTSPHTSALRETDPCGLLHLDFVSGGWGTVNVKPFLHYCRARYMLVPIQFFLCCWWWYHYNPSRFDFLDSLYSKSQSPMRELYRWESVPLHFVLCCIISIVKHSNH